MEKRRIGIVDAKEREENENRVDRGLQSARRYSLRDKTKISALGYKRTLLRSPIYVRYSATHEMEAVRLQRCEKAFKFTLP